MLNADKFGQFLELFVLPQQLSGFQSNHRQQHQWNRTQYLRKFLFYFVKLFLKLFLFFCHALQFALLRVKVLFLPGDLLQGLDFGEKMPPGPVPQLQVGEAVALDHADGPKLVLALGEIPRKNRMLKRSYVCVFTIFF